jgi:hypothetical protein
MSMTKRFYEQLEMELSIRNQVFESNFQYMEEMEIAAHEHYQRQRDQMEAEYSAMNEDLAYGL